MSARLKFDIFGAVIQHRCKTIVRHCIVEYHNRNCFCFTEAHPILSAPVGHGAQDGAGAIVQPTVARYMAGRINIVVASEAVGQPGH